jgi:hypothetical protein
MALHACDTASDLAMQKLISYKTDCFAIAPCCQAQLAQLWRDEVFLQQKRNHALYPMFSNPHFRRECAADITDLMRTLFARAHGYEVSVTEFTSSKHTPKNRILVGTRRGNYCADALKQLQSLTEEVGSLEVWSGYVSPQLPVQS